MQILVIFPRWVGDVVMTTPMLRAVRRHFGSSARITGVLKPMFAELLEGTGWLDQLVFYDRHGRDPARHFRAVARQLRADPAEVAIVVPNSLSSAALAWAGGARRRVGYARHGRGFLLTDRLPPERPAKRRGGLAGWFAVEPASPAAHAMDLAERIGVAREPLVTQLATTAADEALADEVLARLFPRDASRPAGPLVSRPAGPLVSRPAGPLVVFNDNGAFGPAKAWGAERFASLARLVLARQPDARVLVHCGPGDREEARGIVRLADAAGVASLADESRLPFGLSKAVLRRADVVVSSDSGPRHIAAAFGTPTVVLLGPIDPRLSRTEQPRTIEMRQDLPCSPCGRRECPLGHHDCMRLLTVDDVGRSLFALLDDAAARDRVA